MTSEERWCVVTGGRGFAARHLVDMLIRYEMFSVRISDLPPSIKLDPTEEEGALGNALRAGHAQYVCADLRDKAQVVRAFQGAEVVFHMAAPDSSINNLQLHRSVNVLGTQNVIDACIEQQVKRLIYTSSASVVFDGVHGIFNGDESLPYPSKHNDSYSATKAEGEALIIQANGVKGLLTCSLRPSSIFGPGDKLLVPSLVNAARAGKSKFIIGDGKNMYDFTYVENVAHAHICAERALASKGVVAEKASGEAYFVTNMEQFKFWEFMSLILEGLGYERPRIKIPASFMMPIAHLVELTYKLLAPYGMKVPQLTPSRIRLLSCDRTFDTSKAKDRLGYTPIVSLQEGLERTIESYSHLRDEHRSKRDGPSKAHKYLGSGRVADILLWKDKKQTIVTILILAAFYYNFIASGYTTVTAVSNFILVAAIFLFLHANLPQKIFGYTIEKIPVSVFHCSREMSQRVAQSVACCWNTPVKILKSLYRGDDWMLFFKMDGWGCLCKTEKDLLKCLKDAWLFWETDENQIPYHYKAFWEDVTLRYNQGHSQEENLTLDNVLSYFRHIALLYNNDDSLSNLNVVRETGCVTVPGESFTFAEYGGPSSDVQHFLMRNVDRYDDVVSHLYADLVKAKEPAQSFGNCIPVSQARDIYSKVASNMSEDDCGCLIIAATYGSPSFTQLADTPSEKRAGAAKRLVQHTKMMMDRKH